MVAADDYAKREPATKVIQPAWVRAMHWANAVAMILMIMSGWQIYNASPLYSTVNFAMRA
jgi:thiosulfate reductase cytochrome b subunit